MTVTHSWYLEPLDPNTNRVIATELPAENICNQKKCADGKKRDLWLCKHPLIAQLRRAQTQLGLSFKVYVRKGSHGGIKPWEFEQKKKTWNQRSKVTT